MKKYLSILLIAAMLVSSLVSCGEKEAVAESTPDTAADADTTAAQTETETEETGRTMQDEVPELNFEGATFRTIVQESTLYDIYAAEETGDTLNDAIYYRTRDIEERFNVVIAESEQLGYAELSAKIRKTIGAQSDEYDLVLGQMEETGKNAQEGIFRNWYDIPYVDFAKPWWPKSVARDAATVNGKMFVTVSDLCVSYAEQTWGIVFDKDRAVDYGMDGVYDLVRDGKWTIDKLMEMADSVYTDVNGDGAKDADDYYGYVTADNGCLILSYFYGFDQRLAVVEDGKVNMVLNTEKSAEICDKIYRLSTSQGTYKPADSSNAGIYNVFVNENALFCPMQLQYVYRQLRDYENNYGVVPLPKWDEAQSEYYSVCDAGANVMVIPITAQNTEMIGAVVEALSAYSWRTVMPTYCDIVLNRKSARDPESAEMMELILDSRVIDFAYLYDGWTGWVFKLAGMTAREGGFASVYEKNEKAMQNYYEKVLKLFYDDAE